VESYRVPDSATWNVGKVTGSFVIAHPTADTFQVQAILPQPLGADTLDLSLFTQGIRTTVAHCLADPDGTLRVLPPSWKDSRSVHVLQLLDSLRKVDSVTYAGRSESKSLRIAGLQKLYAQLLLAKDTALDGFPAEHPLGLDTAAVIEQVVLLAAAQGKALPAIDSASGLDSVAIVSVIRKLAALGKVDSSRYVPVAPTSLQVSGLGSQIRLVEDSTSKFAIVVGNAVSDTLSVRILSTDTNRISNAQLVVKRSDTIRLTPRPDANGGPVQLELVFREGTRADTVTAIANIESRNDAPSFSGASDLSRTFDTAAVVLSGWATGISAGPANEAGQTVAFEVVCDSGASVFSALPAVEPSGTLRFKAISVGRGVFRVRAHDNGDSTGGQINTSAWKSFAIQLVARPVLQASAISDPLALVEDSTTLVSVALSNLHGSTVDVKFTPADTTLISAATFHLTPDASGHITFPLQAKKDAFGGPILCAIRITDSLDVATQASSIVVAARNDTPSFQILSDSLVRATGTAQTVTGFANHFDPGPNESNQKPSWESAVVSGASLFAKLPFIDSTGTLTFQSGTGMSGEAVVRTRVHDNGDSTGTNVNTSPWKTFKIEFNSAPTITLPTHSLSIWESEATDFGTIVVADAETSTGNLVLERTSSDPSLLPTDSIGMFVSGGNRRITLRPVFGKSGTCVVRFTVRDTMGFTASDSATVVVKRVNRAPLPAATSQLVVSALGWGTATTLPLTYSATPGAGDPAQTFTWGVSLANSADTAIFSVLPSLSGQNLTFTPKVPGADTVALLLQVRDNGGVEHGGTDTAYAPVTLIFTDTAIDSRDGRIYHFRRIGNQTWMTENLRYVPTGSSGSIPANVRTYPASNFTSQTPDSILGQVYDWYQAMDIPQGESVSGGWDPGASRHKGACPSGWHVAAKDEWDTLSTFATPAGGATSDGWIRLKATDTLNWLVVINGDRSGPGSHRYNSGTDELKFHLAANAIDAGYGGSSTYAQFWLPVQVNALTIQVTASMLSPSTTSASAGALQGQYAVRCLLGNGVSSR
jgi:uncharacterized protein (TIGR02145 family)